MSDINEVIKNLRVEAELSAEAEPKISIIMLLYNGRTHLLKRAVQSVLDQTYKNWELILQDDCSTDGTFEMAVGFALLNKRIKIFRNKTNLGITKNRAAAFKGTTGDLICHVDNDDYIYPHALGVMVDTFKKNPDIGFAFSDTSYALEDHVIYAHAAHKGPGGPLSDYGWRHLGMYRRTAYEQTKGYNEALTAPCEDRDLFMQIAEKFPFARVDQALYVYNMSGNRASSTVPKCTECPSRGRCNFLRIWASNLPDAAHREHYAKIITEAQNG